jgi:hypothetical protein
LPTLFLGPPWWRKWYDPPKRRFHQEPHGVTSQKTAPSWDPHIWLKERSLLPPHVHQWGPTSLVLYLGIQALNSIACRYLLCSPVLLHRFVKPGIYSLLLRHDVLP